MNLSHSESFLLHANIRVLCTLYNFSNFFSLYFFTENFYLKEAFAVFMPLQIEYGFSVGLHSEENKLQIDFCNKYLQANIFSLETNG
jgi:hypothetical protein